MTHADRLREEAKFIDETVRLHRRGWPESTLARFEQVAAALRAAADWCERVPHDKDCASLNKCGRCGQRIDAGIHDMGHPAAHAHHRPVQHDCNCHHAEPAP